MFLGVVRPGVKKFHGLHDDLKIMGTIFLTRKVFNTKVFNRIVYTVFLHKKSELLNKFRVKNVVLKNNPQKLKNPDSYPIQSSAWFGDI